MVMTSITLASTDPAPIPPNGALNGGHTLNGKAPWHPPKVTELSSEERARAFLQLYHDAARGLRGVFVLTVIDAPVLDENGNEVRKPKARPQRFRVGDVNGMLEEASARSGQANVYFAPAILRRDMPPGARGEAKDIIAMLGLVIDDDPDAGKRALRPPGNEPTIEICTSREPATNLQPHYIFTRPLPPDKGAELAELLHRKCGGDSGTKDTDHVWRFPRTLNFPSGVKVRERGRPREPQRVEIVGGSYEPVDRRALESMPDREPQKPKANGAHGPITGGSTDRNEIIARLPGWLTDLVETEAEQGDRSSHSHRVTQALFEHELTDGGTTSKEDRIKRLLPIFEQNRLFLPPSRHRTLYDKSTVNLIDTFVETEYMAFPVSEHDDMLDALARLEDPALHLRWPEASGGLYGTGYTNGLYGGSSNDRPTSYLSHNNAGDRMRARHTSLRNGRKLTHERPNR